MNETIKITGIISEIVSFAMQQNHVPIVRQLIIKNLSNKEMKNLTLTITTDPSIVDEWNTKIASIMPEQEHIIDGITLRLSTSKLFELTERINGTLSIDVSDETGLLIQEKHDLSFLSYDEWSGSNIFPEFLSAFVTPNHPYITEIIKKAGTLLANWTDSPSFTGYQSKNPNNIRKQMAAIYGALEQENISYCMPPASFEDYGQKVRLSGTIKEQKLGTCLDLALLYASCLEAAGLHPMIAVIKGHAFTGCWLEEESFSECVQDDVSALAKRIAPGINEICIVETTTFTVGQQIDFEGAVTAAQKHLYIPENFIYLVDIKRSRGSGIRPLPQKRADGTFSFHLNETSSENSSTTDAPKELEILEKLEYVDSIEFTKQQIWERKLLDLSLRNTLLNFRVTKNSIQLFVNSLYDLEDALSSGEEFQIMPKPQDMENSPRDNKIYEGFHNESIWNTLIKSEFQNHRIRTYLNEAALGGAISHLHRFARLSMEENGANTLYLAIGFLKWYENNISEKPRYAPLVMLPIDIIRKSAQRGYVFRIRDEEPQFNVTLLEMLRMNFGLTVTGLDPLPIDEHGIDIKKVFHIVRQLIMDKQHWNVEELAFVGIFSFTQFIMWNDIRNRVDDLKKNKVVSSLLSGQMEWDAGISFLSPKELDDTVTPADLAVPISADSSQLAAIHAAGKGQSFVLHGPPGTGKSQTITNIIANTLYQGKSVLFVAEKMAALTVVEKRLRSIGLSDFCLELHSNKARKKDILNQLEKTLNAGHIKSPSSYLEEANAIQNLRLELNNVVQELHKSRPLGYSLYEVISRAEQYANYNDCMTFSTEQLTSLDAKQYSHWEDLCNMLVAAGTSCSGIYNHALQEYNNPHYRQSEKVETETNLNEYYDCLSNLKVIIKQVADILCLGEIKTYSQYKALAELCTFLTDAILVPSTLLTYENLHLYMEKIILVCASGHRKNSIKDELCTIFSEQVLNFEAEAALLQWKQADTDWFLPKSLGKSKIIKAIKLYAHDKKNYNKSTTPKFLELIIEYHKHEDIIKEATTLFHNLYGILFDNGHCDWSLLETMTKLAVNIQQKIHMITANNSDQNKALQSLSLELAQNVDRFKLAHQADWCKASTLMAKMLELETLLSDQFKTPFGQWHGESDWIFVMCEKASRWIANFDGLRDYCSYLQIKSDLNIEGLHTIYTALEKGSIKETELTGAFIKNLSKAYANNIIDNTPTLNSFRGNLFSQRIEKFKALNKQYETLTRQELVARLSSQIPMLSTGVSGSSEIGILQRAIKSGGRMMPVRKLFENIPNLLRKLCPCMLMSPISVAQYLDPKYPAFDLIIFDEASQLPTSEAVGAIARGKELIVVGDPKQLPPTNFFSSNQIDEANYEKEDLESVLDDCLALSMPQEHLLWHYRSRHESLIAFSNRRYYNNKLHTFPSPNDIVSQVSLIPVEGFYDRGKTKQNKAEAEAIIGEIIRRLSDVELRKRSIGVVTFSSIQQNLIADMLETEFNKYPELDEIANNAEEPIFIKNLENVQGDERDIILFSVGYGPDLQGRVALNFGPLNRDGGWRRLNVAVSRARYEMQIFSVLKPEQIDLSRTRSDGLAGLKAFLEFATRGISTLPDIGDKKDISQNVVNIIAKEIENLGYKVNTNIGCSGYQVDIGIICPNNPDTYLLGILCDSTNYHNGGTALDRNDTQEAVLCGLGWHLYRIWTLDWWDNSKKELSRIQLEIEAAIKGTSAKKPILEELKEPIIGQPPTFEKLQHNSLHDNFKFYELADLVPVSDNLKNADAFASNEHTNIIKQQIETVLIAEAPISHEVLCKRVLEAWGITRMGARINRRFASLFIMMQLKSTNRGDTIFYWNKETDPLQYDDFRVPSVQEKSRRTLEQISAEEIASAVKYILNRQIGLLKEDLEREISRIFGFARCTEAMQKYIDIGIVLAVEKEWAVVSGERISMPS